MKNIRSPLQYYALCVCLVMVVVSLILTCIIGYQAIGLIDPISQMSCHEYRMHSSNEAFWERLSREKKTAKKPGESELTAQRLQSQEKYIKDTKYCAWQNLKYLFLSLIINVLFLGIHANLYRRETQRLANITCKISPASSNDEEPPSTLL